MRCHWDVLFGAGTQANEAQGHASRSCQPSKPDGHTGAGHPREVSDTVWAVAVVWDNTGKSTGLGVWRQGWGVVSCLSSITYCVTWDWHCPS